MIDVRLRIRSLIISLQKSLERGSVPFDLLLVRQCVQVQRHTDDVRLILVICLTLLYGLLQLLERDVLVRGGNLAVRDGNRYISERDFGVLHGDGPLECEEARIERCPAD